jgi:hypothetical protein
MATLKVFATTTVSMQQMKVRLVTAKELMNTDTTAVAVVMNTNPERLEETDQSFAVGAAADVGVDDKSENRQLLSSLLLSSVSFLLME